MPLYGSDWTLDDLQLQAPDMVYWPWAAFGVFAPGLPLDADIQVSTAFADAISSKIGAFLLPVQPFATRCPLGGPGLVLDAGLMYDMALDLAQEMKRQGFSKLVIQENSAGRSILYALQRHLNAHAMIQTVWVNPLNLTGKLAWPDQVRIAPETVLELLLSAGQPDGTANLARQVIFTNGVDEAVREIRAAFEFMAATGAYA